MNLPGYLPLGEGARASDQCLWFWESCYSDDWEAGNHPAFQSDQLGCPILGREVVLDQLGLSSSQKRARTGPDRVCSSRKRARTGPDRVCSSWNRASIGG